MHDEKMNCGKSFFHIIVNVLALSLSAAHFIVVFLTGGRLLPENTAYCGTLLLTVCVVHSLKAFRLYFLIVGDGVPLLRFVSAFAKTALMNVVLPFKIGELFRIYTFGNLTRDWLKGFSVVLLDRFADIAALLMIFLLLNVFAHLPLGGIFFFLAAASVFLVLFYLILPDMIRHWNGYFISSAASTRHLRALSLLDKIRSVHTEIQGLVSGRFFAIFTLSALSWLCEIGSLVVCRRFFDDDSDFIVADYLSSALIGGDCAPMRNFILASIFFLCAVLAAAYSVRIMRRQ